MYALLATRVSGVLAVACTLAAGTASATKEFQATTKLPCASCHNASDDSLNAFGQAFKNNGFRLPQLQPAQPAQSPAPQQNKPLAQNPPAPPPQATSLPPRPPPLQPPAQPLTPGQSKPQQATIAPPPQWAQPKPIQPSIGTAQLSATQRIGFVQQMLEGTCGEFEGREIAGGGWGLLGAIAGLDSKNMAFRYTNFHVINNELRYSQYRVTKRGNATDGVNGAGSLFHYAVRLPDIDFNRMQVQQVKVDNDDLGIFFFNLTCTGAGVKCVSRHETRINAPQRTLDGINQRLESYIPAGSATTTVQEVAPIHVCNRPGTSGGSAAEAERLRNEMIAAINGMRSSGEVVNIAFTAPVAAPAPQIVNPPPVFTGITPAPAFGAAPAPSGAAPVAFGGADMPPISSQAPFAPKGPIPLFPRN